MRVEVGATRKSWLDMRVGLTAYGLTQGVTLHHHSRKNNVFYLRCYLTRFHGSRPKCSFSLSYGWSSERKLWIVTRIASHNHALSPSANAVAVGPASEGITFEEVGTLARRSDSESEEAVFTSEEEGSDSEDGYREGRTKRGRASATASTSAYLFTPPRIEKMRRTVAESSFCYPSSHSTSSSTVESITIPALAAGYFTLPRLPVVSLAPRPALAIPHAVLASPFLLGKKPDGSLSPHDRIASPSSSNNAPFVPTPRKVVPRPPIYPPSRENYFVPVLRPTNLHLQSPRAPPISTFSRPPILPPPA